jgi:hypothetical protein
VPQSYIIRALAALFPCYLSPEQNAARVYIQTFVFNYFCPFPLSVAKYYFHRFLTYHLVLLINHNLFKSKWSLYVPLDSTSNKTSNVRILSNLVLTCPARRILGVFSERISGNITSADGVSSVQRLWKPNVTGRTGLQQQQNALILESSTTDNTVTYMMGATRSLTFPTFMNFDFFRTEEEGRHAEEYERVPVGVEPKCSKLRCFGCDVV